MKLGWNILKFNKGPTTESHIWTYCAVSVLICMLHVAEQLQPVHSEGVGVMHARGQGGSNKQKRRRRNIFNTKPLKIKKKERDMR